MNAVVYARFSSHRQGEQSIESQVLQKPNTLRQDTDLQLYMCMQTEHRRDETITESSFN